MALDPIANLIGSAVTEAGEKIWFSNLRSYLAGLFGIDGVPATARTALGLDGLTRPNLLINPNWLLDQINEGALYTVTGGGANVLGPDGWSGSAVAAPGVFKLRTLADPDNAALKCLEITCTTIDAAIGAADAYYIYTAIEGYDCADLMIGTASAASVTLKFKAKFNLTGVYGISLANSATNRSYTGIFTVASTSEAEYTLTIPLDTTGTWLYTNGVGLYLRICLAAGSNFQTAAGAWGANNMLTTSAQANFMSSVSNIGYIKRIQLVPGVVALAYGPQDFQKELAKAQRYYEKSYEQGTAPGSATILGMIGSGHFAAAASSNVSLTPSYKVPKRGAPTLNTWSATGGANNFSTMIAGAGINNDNIASIVISNSSANGFVASNTTTASQTVAIHYAANARLS